MQMNNTIFQNVMKNITCHTGKDLSVIGFVGKYENYEIGFYGNETDNYELVVEDFGFMDNAVWNQLEANEGQIMAMAKILTEKKNELLENVQGLEEEFNGDYYSLYGVNGGMFY